MQYHMNVFVLQNKVKVWNNKKMLFARKKKESIDFVEVKQTFIYKLYTN